LYNKDKTALVGYPPGKTGAFTIPDGVTEIGSWAFENCAKLTNVIIPDSVTIIGYDAWNFAFRGCSGLTSITIGTGLTDIGNNYQGTLFSGCTSLTEINVDGSNTAYSSVDGVLYNAGGKVLIVYPCGKGGDVFIIPDGVTTIGYAAFYGNTSLTRVIIPDSVNNIMDYAFNGCTNLARIIFEGSVSGHVYGGAFMGDLKDKYFEIDPVNGISGIYLTTAPVNENSIWKRRVIQGTYYEYSSGRKTESYVSFSSTDNAEYFYSGVMSQTFYGTWTLINYDTISTTLNGGLIFTLGNDENTIYWGNIPWIKE
jgi:hypothetical protein